MTGRGGEKTQIFNVRLSLYLADLVERAVEVSGMKKSPWAREALEAAARKELAQAEREKRGRSPGGGFVQPVGRCTHPLPARRTLIDEVVCGVCSQRIRKL